MKPILILAGLTLPAFSSIQGAIVSDDFNSYADGSLVGAAGSPWVNHSGTVGQVDIASGKVNLTSTDSEDVSVALGTTYSSGVLYYGLTINVSATNFFGTYVAHFKDTDLNADSDFVGRLFLKTGTVEGSTVAIGVANRGSVAVYNTTDFALNTDIQIVMGYDFDTKIATLWINPSDISSANISGTDAVVLMGTDLTQSFFGLREQSSMGTLTVDNLLVSDNFNDFLAVPEPSTCVLIALGLSGLFMLCRMKKPSAV